MSENHRTSPSSETINARITYIKTTNKFEQKSEDCSKCMYTSISQPRTKNLIFPPEKHDDLMWFIRNFGRKPTFGSRLHSSLETVRSTTPDGMEYCKKIYHVLSIELH
jgi:hypothetical protein